MYVITPTSAIQTKLFLRLWARYPARHGLRLIRTDTQLLFCYNNQKWFISDQLDEAHIPHPNRYCNLMCIAYIIGQWLANGQLDEGHNRCSSYFTYFIASIYD